FGLALFQGIALVFGLAALTRQLFAAMPDLGRLVPGALQLAFESDDRLLLAVLFGIQRRDRAARLCDSSLERSRLLGETAEHIAVDLDPCPQLFDLALGFENAAQLGGIAAGYPVRAAKHVAGAGDDRRR